jgi:tRNA(Ile)-lysidine synthase
MAPVVRPYRLWHKDMRHSGGTPAERARRPGPAETGAVARIDGADALVETPVAGALSAAGRVVLAVSGGRDSMTLLRAAVTVMRPAVAAVATFDHGTGAHAAAAVDLVTAMCADYGVPCVTARAPAGTPATEAAWRLARWRFLRSAAARYTARVATAHTRDDQLETLIIRILRHAGARGLAGLDADGGVVRPWLSVHRAVVSDYAARHGVAYIDDPSNESRAFLRNRVRLDLLPALLRVRPELGAELLRVAENAAQWRRDVERHVAFAHPAQVEGDGMSIAASELAHYDQAALAIVWPVLAARMGLVLDRRGMARLSDFTLRGRAGGEIQLSGGVAVQRSTFSFVLRRRGPARRTGHVPQSPGAR